MKLFKLMNTGMMDQGQVRRRLWMEPDRRVTIASNLTLTVLFDRQGARYRACALVEGVSLSVRHVLPMASYLDLARSTGLLIIPRAVEVDGWGRPQRLLMEFQSVRPSIRFAV